VANDRRSGNPILATESAAAPSTKPGEAPNRVNDDAMLDRMIATLHRLRLEREAVAAAHANDPADLGLCMAMGAAGVKVEDAERALRVDRAQADAGAPGRPADQAPPEMMP
jgi:hypothetical protein